MLKRITLAAAVTLMAAGAAGASIQVRQSVGWLGEGDWQLRQEKGEVYLVKSRYKGGARVTHTWAVSNPTIKGPGGRLLGYDAKGRDPKARLVKKAGKGDATRWSFEAVSYISPKRSKSDRIRVGPSGMTFRVRAAEGPCKGWYLATKADGKDKKALVLVRARKDAAVFTYIEEYYYVR